MDLVIDDMLPCTQLDNSHTANFFIYLHEMVGAPDVTDVPYTSKLEPLLKLGMAQPGAPRICLKVKGFLQPQVFLLSKKWRAWVKFMICSPLSNLLEPASSIWMELHVHKSTADLKDKQQLRCTCLHFLGWYNMLLIHMSCILVAHSSPELLRVGQILPFWLLLNNILLHKQFSSVSVRLHLQNIIQCKDERVYESL